MSKVQLKGRVYPAVLNITVSNIPKIDWRSELLNFTVAIQVSIQNGLAIAECETSIPITDAVRDEILIRSYDLIRATVDLSSFTFARGLIFLLESYVDENGTETPFIAQDISLLPLSTSVAPVAQFGIVLPIVLTSPSLFFALRDLISAITEFHRSTTSCARAIDTLRSIFVPSGGKKEDGWEPLRTNLNLDRSYIEPIMYISRGPRHGDSTHIPGTIATDITRRTWIIMNRFLEYKKRGDTALPESEFPILT